MTDYATPFLARLGAPSTADMLAAVGVWQRQESGGTVLGNNAWNLHAGPACPTNAHAGVAGLNPSQWLRSGTIPGLVGNRWAGPGDKSVAIFDTPANGSAAAADNLLAWNDYGYPAVVLAARKGDALGFLDALGRSSWSGGRYGTANGGPNVLIEAYRRIVRPPAPAGTPPPLTGGQSMPVITAYPEPKIGTTPPGTRRWAVVAPYDELPVLVGPGLYVLSALVFFPPGGSRSGTFIQTATVPNFLLRAADVTFVVTEANILIDAGAVDASAVLAILQGTAA